MFHSDRLDMVRVRRELGWFEDYAAPPGWAWDAGLSRRVDALCVQIEGRRA